MSISASRYRSSLTLKSLAFLTPPDYRLIFDFYSPPKQSKYCNVGSAVDHVITFRITSAVDMFSHAVLEVIPH